MRKFCNQDFFHNYRILRRQNFETLNLLKLSFEKVTCRALTLFILFTCLTWNMSFNIHPSSLFDWWFRTNLKKGWSTNLAHHVRHVHYAKRKSPRGEFKAFVLIISSFVCRKIIFNCEKSVFKMPRACGQSISEILLPARFSNWSMSFSEHAIVWANQKTVFPQQFENSRKFFEQILV